MGSIRKQYVAENFVTSFVSSVVQMFHQKDSMAQKWLCAA